MKVKVSNQATSAWYEYFLFAVIAIQAAIAALAYKVMPDAGHVWPGSMFYLAAMYGGVLAWVFYQLNRLHGKRKAARKVERKAIETDAPPAATAKPAVARGIFGLTGTQIAVVLLVFVAAVKIFSWALSNVLSR